MIFLLLVVLMLPCIGLHAQTSVFQATRLTVEDGLSDNMVYCALQDRQGFLWFGTRNGLNRYDGYRITAFMHDRNNPQSLSDAPVHSLFEDSKGRLWIGTAEGGLEQFDPVKEQFVHYGYKIGGKNALLPGVIIGISEDRSGCLWIAVRQGGRGVQKFDPERGTFTSYSHQPGDSYSLSDNEVMGLCSDKNGDIWVATRFFGVNRYDPANDRFINYRTAPEYRFAYSKSIGHISPAAGGGFWLADSSTNVWKVVPQGNRFSVWEPDLKNNPISIDDGISSIATSIDGTVWVGMKGNGFYTIDPVTKQATNVTPSETDRYGLASNRVYDLYADIYGDVWICTDAGVERFHRGTSYARHFTHNPLDPSTISYPQVRSVLCNKDRFLIGMGGGGLDISDSSGIKHYRNNCAPTNTAANTLNILYRGRDGTIWAGTNDNLYRVDPSTGVFSRPGYTLLRPRVWALQETEDGTLWAGMLFGGLARIDLKTGKTQSYLLDEKSEKNGAPVSVHVLYEDKKHNLWLGTSNGLYIFDRKADKPVLRAINRPDSSSLSYNHIWYIHEARDGNLWLGTSGGGLNLFDPATGRCTRYDKNAGLPSEIICGILEDDHNNLWVSSNSGLFRFTPSTGKSRAFGVDDGIYIREFHFKACCRDSRGMMSFAGLGGVIRFHPDSLASGTRPHRLVFTGFKVFDHSFALDSSLAFKKQIVLSRKSNYFSVEFAALDFAGPNQHRYRYKLQGYDAQWQHTDGLRPFASYTDVAPGNYTLLVESSSGSDNWNASAVLNISITPAWWQTLWFRIAAVLALVLTGIGLLRWYLGSVRRKSAMERRLVEFQLQVLRAQINPHFVFNSLNSIYYFIITEENDKAQEYLCTFSVLLRSILEYSQKKFLSLEQEISVLSMYLEMETMRFAGQLQYEIKLDPAIDARQSYIPSMLLQPYVENAIRHGLLPKSGDRRLVVEFRRDAASILCVITDNGIGRAQAAEAKRRSVHVHTSQGMALSEQRIEGLNALYGNFYALNIDDLMENGVAAGTRITIRIPFGARGEADSASS